MKRSIFSILLALSSIGIPLSHADIQQTARAVQEAHQNAVVHLTAVMEVNGRDGRKREATVETLGTIIQEDGLIVTSNSMLGQAPNKDGQSPELQDLKALMPDGSEIAATLVLQDTDLDLAFVRLSKEKDGSTFDVVPLLEDGPKLEVFDQVISLARQEEDLQRLSSVRVARVNAVIKRPRLIYVASVGAYGGPAFDEQGALVGIYLRKIHQGTPASQIILPTKTISKSAQQFSVEDDKPATEVHEEKKAPDKEADPDTNESDQEDDNA